MHLTPRSRLIATAIAIGMICGIAAMALPLWKLARIGELKTYDWRMTLMPANPRPRIVMLYVDEDSLRHVEGLGVGWPWPRQLYAQAMSFLRRGGARLVFFDIFFSEDSVYGVADDETFADGLAAGPPSYLAAFATAADTPADPQEGIVIGKMAIGGAEPPDWLFDARSFQSLPIGPLARAAHAFGNVQSPPDEDGVYRRIPPAWRRGNALIPSIALKIAADLGGRDKVFWSGPRRLMLGSRAVPLDAQGNMLMHFPATPASFPVYSLAEILVAEQHLIDGETPRINPHVFRDAIVIVGLAAPGLYDLKPTPIGAMIPGPFIHAVAISNILEGRALSPVPAWLAAAAILAAGVAAALALTLAARAWTMSALFAATMTAVVGGALVLFQRGLWLPLVPPLAAAALSSMATLTKNYLTEGRTKRAIKRAFAQYIAPEIVEQIAHDPENIGLGGAKKTITILFSDIAGFTSTAEGMSPETLVCALNEYLTAMTGIILIKRGTLDKYIGDAIMAFWGAPLHIDDHARLAVEAAISMQQRLVHIPSFPTRIGMHTGEAVVGNIGSHQRFNYTAIGDAVNLASRIEGLCKFFGVRTLMSADTHRGLDPSIISRRVGCVRVVGRSQPIDIYEPLGFAGEVAQRILESCQLVEDGIRSADFGNIDAAIALFARAAIEYGDPVAAFHRNRCMSFKDAQDGPSHYGIIDFTAK